MLCLRDMAVRNVIICIKNVTIITITVTNKLQVTVHRVYFLCT